MDGAKDNVVLDALRSLRAKVGSGRLLLSALALIAFPIAAGPVSGHIDGGVAFFVAVAIIIDIWCVIDIPITLLFLFASKDRRPVFYRESRTIIVYDLGVFASFYGVWWLMPLLWKIGPQ